MHLTILRLLARGHVYHTIPRIKIDFGETTYANRETQLLGPFSERIVFNTIRYTESGRPLRFRIPVSAKRLVEVPATSTVVKGHDWLRSFTGVYIPCCYICLEREVILSEGRKFAEWSIARLKGLATCEVGTQFSAGLLLDVAGSTVPF